MHLKKINKIKKLKAALLITAVMIGLTACSKVPAESETIATDIYVTGGNVENNEDAYLPPCKHNILEEDRIEPTCTEDGILIEYCKECEKVLTEKVLNKAYHQNVEEKSQEAYCDVAGYKRIICADCGTCISEHVIAATGHTWNEWIVSVKANPFNNGIMVRSCTVCGREEKKEYNETIGATHLYIPSVNIDADIAAGMITQDCVDISGV